MTREKIIQLARECGIEDLCSPPITSLDTKLEAFYHAAQAEAFKAAAELCSNNFDMTGHYLAYRIREMVKEKQNATD